MNFRHCAFLMSLSISLMLIFLNAKFWISAISICPICLLWFDSTCLCCDESLKCWYDDDLAKDLLLGVWDRICFVFAWVIILNTGSLYIGSPLWEKRMSLNLSYSSPNPIDFSYKFFIFDCPPDISPCLSSIMDISLFDFGWDLISNIDESCISLLTQVAPSRPLGVYLALVTTTIRFC